MFKSIPIVIFTCLFSVFYSANLYLQTFTSISNIPAYVTLMYSSGR